MFLKAFSEFTGLMEVFYSPKRFMYIRKYLSTILTTLFLSITVASNAQENELQSVSFGDRDTEYSLSNQGEKLIINAKGQESASGLFVPNPEVCLENNQLSWSWRVDQIQPSANIEVEEKEDYGASILIIFGKPSLLSKPKGLIYGFTNTDLPPGSIVESPRAPDNFRTIVLANKQSPLKNWLEYKRNIIQDYQLAYGEIPDKDLHSIGIFTDNDQTQEPVKAAYELKSCNLTSQDINL